MSSLSDKFSSNDNTQEYKSNEDKTSNDEESNNNSDRNNQPKRKNRTLQYYKFLFYTMKTEIKVHDFLKLLRNSNTAEFSLWAVSVLLFANIPKNFPILKEGETNKETYNGVFIWLHIMHIVRACNGMYLGYKLPRSYQIMDTLKRLSDDTLSKTLFNDILRETLYNKVIVSIKSKKIFIISYLFITIINIIFDIIDFFFILAKISKAATSAKVVFMTYLLIAVIYLLIDCAYIFWIFQLKYVFPKKYLSPIHQLYNGLVNLAVKVFKLQKVKTDVIEEAKNQQAQNGGVNILEFIMKDSFGIYQNDTNKYLPKVNIPDDNERNIREKIQQNNYPDSSENLG